MSSRQTPHEALNIAHGNVQSYEKNLIFANEKGFCIIFLLKVASRARA